MRRKLRVLFAAFEAVPFMKTGGLGDVAGSLPKAIKDAGCEIRVILPKFGTIADKYKDKMVHVADFRVNLSWRNLFCGIEKLTHKGVTYYFIDNEYYFKRDSAYGYYDDGERIAFFSRAILESLQYLPDFKCDVIHCNDWHTSLVPVFLREFYRGSELYDNVRTVFTIHNIKFQGKYSAYALGDVLGLDSHHSAVCDLICGEDTISYMKSAVCASDILTTVSPSYAEEIKTEFYGEGLDGVFRARGGALYGILNGVDTGEYGPEDGLIAERFSVRDMSGKAACKQALQRELSLEEKPDTPLIVMIGRLTEQKGLDLVERILDELMGKNVQIAVLGTGDKKYENLFRFFEDKYRGRVNASICFDEALSHRMYAGADMLLMPSLFEPCGLSQMIAMRYGTLPIVRETGGLKDSVVPYNMYTGEGTGFSFANYNAHEMMFTIFNAIELYSENKEAWSKLMEQAMTSDFTWDRAAKEYIGLYQMLHPEITPYKSKGQ